MRKSRRKVTKALNPKMKGNWIKGFALYKKMWGGVYWTGVTESKVGGGPMWTRASKRARVFSNLRAAYDAAKDIPELQECVPVRIVDEN